MIKRSSANSPVIRALLLSSLSSVFIYLIGYFFYDDTDFWFLNWNLLLAWLPLLFAWLLTRHLRSNAWLTWPALIYTGLWLGFLPNSFYIASDLVHLRLASSSISLFYVVMVLSFTLSGLLVGYTSLYLLHKQLIKKSSELIAHSLVGVVLLLCSFAIYLGRYQRWNTWDVLINPAGILFDVSDRFINPAAHEQTFRITLLFFILLGTTYAVIWQLIHAIRPGKK